jgi:DNA-binding transcriptional ArsR family regulator
VAKYFRVLSDPTRVRVLELLDDHGELSVGELVGRLGESQPKVSNHLACLRWCGFVERERRRRHVFYRVADGRVLEVVGLVRRCSRTTPSTSRAAGARRCGRGRHPAAPGLKEGASA